MSRFDVFVLFFFWDKCHYSVFTELDRPRVETAFIYPSRVWHWHWRREPGPPEMTDDEKHWKDPVATTIAVSLGEPLLLSIWGLYSFKRFTVDYWRSRRFRYQWHRRLLFLDVLNQNLRALSNRRHSSLYPTWPFDTWFLQLIRKKFVRGKLYEDDFESVCDVKFVTWFSEVCVLIRQYVVYICINSEDFIRIAITDVFIWSESSSVRIVIRTFLQAWISLRVFHDTLMTRDRSRASLTSFLDVQRTE